VPERAPAHTTPFTRRIFFAFARYVPLRTSNVARKLPSCRVEVVMIHRHAPPRKRLMTTGTLLAHAEYPSFTLTWPLTDRPWTTENVIERLCTPPVTVKVLVVAVPDGVVSVMPPLVAPPGTLAVTLPSFTNVKAAAVPLNLTELTPVKPEPRRVTMVPTFPLAGENPVIFGPVTVKSLPDVAVPAAFVTLIFPVVAPVGTVVVILPLVTTVNGAAAVPLKRTAVVPENPDPKMETEVPTLPLFGLKPVTFGAPVPVTVKFPKLWSVPAALVTETLPVVAPLGTVVVICVPAPLTLNGADVPLNVTAVAPPNLRPVIVTGVPTGPFLGAKFVMLGAVPVTVKLLVVAVPFGVETVICPVVAPVGTVVEICVPAPLTENAAPVPWNATDEAPRKFVPLIATFVPTGPLCGLKLVIFGAAPAQEGRTPTERTSTTDTVRATNRAVLRVPSVLAVMGPPASTFLGRYLPLTRRVRAVQGCPTPTGSSVRRAQPYDLLDAVDDRNQREEASYHQPERALLGAQGDPGSDARSGQRADHQEQRSG
jgi:hypothetical protein